MLSGFLFNGIDLEVLCEIRRNGTSAHFGGATNRFIGANGDLFSRFASIPTGFGYAKVAWPSNLSPQPYTWPEFNGSIPSKQGYRPNTTAEQIKLTTAGEWHVWREEANQRLAVKNPSGSITYYDANTYWEQNIPPHIMICKMVGGGGKGGNGNGTKGGAGGGGGAGWIGWIDIPDSKESPLICLVGGPRSASKITHTPSGEYVNCAAGNNGGNATSSSTPGGSVSSTISSSGGQFVSINGGTGSGGGTGDGQSISVPAFSISPETSFAAWSKSGGGGGGRGGGGGASMLGNGGTKGRSDAAAGVGGLYGGGGGGGTWALFDGKPGADGGAGVIVLGY